MRNTGSEVTSEMVAPPGSTSEGAFSCTGLADEEEFFWGSLLEEEDCATAGRNPERSARAVAAEIAANR
jgi:hypothetical protein